MKTTPIAIPSTPMIGIDIGGTKVAGGIVLLPEGRILVSKEIPTQPAGSAENFASRIENFLEELVELARAEKWMVDGVGLALCELVNRQGAVVSAHSIPWQGFDVGGRLGRFGQVMVEADVRAAALAEAHLGAGRNLSSFLYVGIGTGISCSFVQGGVPWTGSGGLAGTFASSPWPMPSTNQSGLPSLEERCSGPALVQRFRERGGTASRAEEVFNQADKGSDDARAVLLEAGETLGQSVGWLVNVLDPEVVIVGGGVGMAQGIYFSALERGMRRQIWSLAHRGVPLHCAQTGQNAGWLGAAVAAWKARGNTSNKETF